MKKKIVEMSNVKLIEELPEICKKCRNLKSLINEKDKEERMKIINEVEKKCPLDNI